MPRVIRSTASPRRGGTRTPSAKIDPLAKRAKDCGSAAVMIALLAAAMTWVTIFGSHYL